ncbi:unnamed protein product [Protopolystoma xenopodis]|uniref:F-box/LRR-repeat protein 15-like leucin rich repeat domain-containing protein n=1 Tax=Protopolystoma xenopodis TaxID=117903 RepID=A0A448XFN6_9PLAT|nr:unnamed protein product [Protopolystoma xenopodis]
MPPKRLGMYHEHGIKWLLGYCGKNLTHISLIGCAKGAFQSERLVHLIASLCPSVQSVDLSFVHSVCDPGVIRLARETRRLVTVCLNGAQKLTNNAIKQLVHYHSSSLERLELSGCFWLNSEIFGSLGSCHALRSLDFGLCHRLSSRGFLEMLEQRDPHFV